MRTALTKVFLIAFVVLHRMGINKTRDDSFHGSCKVDAVRRMEMRDADAWLQLITLWFHHSPFSLDSTPAGPRLFLGGFKSIEYIGKYLSTTSRSYDVPGVLVVFQETLNLSIPDSETTGSSGYGIPGRDCSGVCDW